MKKNFLVVVLIVGAIIFLAHSLVEGLELHQDILFPAISWKWSLVIGMVAITTCQFGILDPIWRKSLKKT